MKISYLPTFRTLTPIWQKLSWGQRTICLAASCVLIALIFKKAVGALKESLDKKPPPPKVEDHQLKGQPKLLTEEHTPIPPVVTDTVLPTPTPGPTPTKLKLEEKALAARNARLKRLDQPHPPTPQPAFADTAPVSEPNSSTNLETIRQEIEVFRTCSQLNHIKLIQPGTTKDLLDDISLQDYLSTCLNLKEEQERKTALQAPTSDILNRKILSLKDLRALSILSWSDTTLKEILPNNEPRIKPNNEPRIKQNTLKDNIVEAQRDIEFHLDLFEKIKNTIPLDLKGREPERKQALEKLINLYKLICTELEKLSENLKPKNISTNIANFEEIKNTLGSVDYLRQIWVLRCYLLQQDILIWVNYAKPFNSLSVYTQRYPMKTWELFNLASKRLDHETLSDFLERAKKDPEFKNIEIDLEFLKRPISFDFCDSKAPIEFYLQGFLQIAAHNSQNILESSLKHIQNKKIYTLADLEVLGLLSFLDLNLNSIEEESEAAIAKAVEQLKNGLAQLIKLREAVIPYNQKEARKELILLTQGVNILQRNLNSFNQGQALRAQRETLNEIIQEARAMFYLHHIYLLKNYLLQEGIERFSNDTTATTLSEWNKTRRLSHQSFYDVLTI